MTKHKIVYPLYILIVFFCNSCVKNINFNQANTIKLTPSYLVSLIYMQFDQTSFVNIQGVGVTRITDVTKIQLFDNSTVNDKLEKIVIDFEITNTFNRQFILDFAFLDDADVEVYHIPKIIIREGVTNYKVKEEIKLNNNSTILNAKKIAVTLELLPSSNGSSISNNDNKTFVFKSAGTFYFRID